MNAGEIGGVANKAGARFTTMRVPHAALAPALKDIGKATMQPVAAGNEALRLLLNYVSIFRSPKELATARSRELFVTHIYDLMVLAVGAGREAASVAERRGLPAARLRAIKSVIAKLIADGAPIDINVVAARHAVTPRYVQLLFESGGTTFSEFVLLQRLASAHRQLADPHFLHLKVSDIIFGAGFNDVSYFNRVFRRHFGCSPSEIRAAHQGEI